MQFDVDNATEKIIDELQEAINSSIQDIHDNQKSIIQKVNSLEDSLSLDEVERSVRDMAKKLADLDERVENIERSNEDVNSSLDKISSKANQIIEYNEKTNLDDMKATIQLMNGSLAEIKKEEEKLIATVSGYKTDFNKLADALTNIQNSLESLSLQLMEVKTSEKDTLAVVQESNNRIVDLGKTLERISAENKEQAKQIREISDYLNKPGISRLFRGMRKETTYGDNE